MAIEIDWHVLPHLERGGLSACGDLQLYGADLLRTARVGAYVFVAHLHSPACKAIRLVLMLSLISRPRVASVAIYGA